MAHTSYKGYLAGHVRHIHQRCRYVAGLWCSFSFLAHYYCKQHNCMPGWRRFADETAFRIDFNLLMIKKIISYIRSLHNKSNHSSNKKITCYHCGDKSLPKYTIYVQFYGEIRPVCCHGCATILRTVDEMGMTEEYLAHKTKLANQDEQSKS